MQIFLGVAATLMANQHHRLPLETGPARQNGGVFAKQAIAVEFDEVGKRQLDVVRRKGTPRKAGNLYTLQGRQLLIDLDPERREFGLERLQLVGHIQRTFRSESLQLVDLLFELGQRTRELQHRCSSHDNPGKRTPRLSAAGAHKAHAISAKQRAKIGQDRG